jgi:hypothetical protein
MRPTQAEMPDALALAILNLPGIPLVRLRMWSVTFAMIASRPICSRSPASLRSTTTC